MRVGKARTQRGFTYAVMIFVVALAGFGLAWAGQVYSEKLRRENEAELLRIGEAFVRAIESYYASSPGTQKAFPQRLEDLLQDNRFAQTRRHLRRIYVDPLTGRAEWGLVRAAEGGIAGVRSLSESSPLATTSIGLAGAVLKPATRYSDWEFVYVPAPKNTSR